MKNMDGKKKKKKTNFVELPIMVTKYKRLQKTGLVWHFKM